MLRKLTYITVLLAALLPVMALAEVSLDLKCSRAKIFLGESFNITLSVNGADSNIRQPEFAESGPAEITFLGSHSNSRSSIQIINGKFTKEVFRGRVLSYAFKPQEAGVFRTGPVIVYVNGKPIRHPGTSVLVKGIEKQDNVIVSVKASSKSVLVEEPFEISLSVAIKELPDPYWKNNEPIHPNYLPHISAEFLEITDEKDTLVRPDLNNILSGIIDQSGRAPAFQLNNYKSRGMGMSSFFDADPFQSRPLRFKFKQETKKINNIRYRVYTLTLPYKATGESEHTFGPVTFKGKIISNVTEQREAEVKDIYTIGPAVTVRVIPPPDEGRPDDFIGSVGKNITAKAQFDTSVCKVGDPLTLTLEITGNISISNMRTPVLNLQENLTRDFRIYDDNVKTETLKNGKRFSYRVRPTKAGTLEFPPVKISYFDTAAQEYRTVATSPLPIQAEFTTQVSAGSDGEGGGIIELKKALPFPCGITLTESGLSRLSLLPSRRVLITLILIGPLLVAMILILPGVLRLIRGIKLRRTRSGALAHALKQIQKAQSAAELTKAIRGWHSARLGVTGEAITGRESKKLLKAHSVPDEICTEMNNLIATLDEAMYRPDAITDLPRERCSDILKRTDSALSTKEGSGKEEE